MQPGWEQGAAAGYAGPLVHAGILGLGIWEFPELGGTLFWGPYNKDPTI